MRALGLSVDTVDGGVEHGHLVAEARDSFDIYGYVAMHDFDVVLIGLGPGGESAAWRLLHAGKRAGARCRRPDNGPR
jgi:hypothetical protein